jgi:hypothetical protein
VRNLFGSNRRRAAVGQNFTFGALDILPQRAGLRAGEDAIFDRYQDTSRLSTRRAQLRIASKYVSCSGSSLWPETATSQYSRTTSRPGRAAYPRSLQASATESLSQVGDEQLSLEAPLDSNAQARQVRSGTLAGR